MPADVFKAVQIAEIESMAMNGFKDIFVMGDHGGGQAEMKEAAAEEDAKLASKGVHVYYIADFYQKTHDDVDMYMYEHKLPIGGHGAMMETSERLYLGIDAGRAGAADLQDGAVRSDRTDARAVESGARRANGAPGVRRYGRPARRRSGRGGRGRGQDPERGAAREQRRDRRSAPGHEGNRKSRCRDRHQQYGGRDQEADGGETAPLSFISF